MPPRTAAPRIRYDDDDDDDDDDDSINDDDADYGDDADDGGVCAAGEDAAVAALRAQLRGATLVSSEHLFYDYATYWAHRVELAAHDARVPSRIAFYGDSELGRRKSDGARRLEEMFKMLDIVCPTRSEWQQKLHMQMIRATLFQILGSDYAAQRDAVCAEYGWDDGPRSELLAIASRRSGKTYGTAIFAAALAIVVPNVEIVIFSLSKRQSQKLAALIARFVLGTEQGRRMLKDLSVERMTLQGDTSATDVRLIQSYPGVANPRLAH